MTIEDVKKHIRDVYDFPVQGIVFKDLTTAFKDAECIYADVLLMAAEALNRGNISDEQTRNFISCLNSYVKMWPKNITYHHTSSSKTCR